MGNIKTVGNMTRRPSKQMSDLQKQLASLCDKVNKVVSDTHFLAHEANNDETREGVYQWIDDWEKELANAKRQISAIKLTSYTDEGAIRPPEDHNYIVTMNGFHKHGADTEEEVWKIIGRYAMGATYSVESPKGMPVEDFIPY